MDLIAPTDPRLTAASALVTDYKKGAQIARQLYETLQEPKWKEIGAGLAAPQIGINEQVIWALGQFFINPVITNHRGEKIPPRCFRTPVLEGGEGCLSFGPLRVVVPRWEVIDVSFVGAADVEILKKGKWDENLEMKVQTVRFRGFQAVLLQHEIDHLNGITLETHNKSAANNPLQLSEAYPLG